jgi:hypothetical protein
VPTLRKTQRLATPTARTSAQCSPRIPRFATS